VAVTTLHNHLILHEALGTDYDEVEFVDRDEWYTQPAHVIAGYHQTVRDCVRAGAETIRVIGEVQFGTTPREWNEWIAYESILNRALADEPAWIMCPYDARVLPDPVLEGAWQTHPHVLNGEMQASPHYHEPEDLVRALTPDPEPLPQLRAMAVSEDPHAFRADLARDMTAAAVPREAAANMLAATGEILGNARRHGRGAPTVRVGVVDDRFVCEISDRGPGITDPLAGYTPPKPDDDTGAGLWVARQLTSRLELHSSPEGLTARLWA
jgi:anti-sigma regulatory factor (Ser/Thr protein kinase)